MSLNKKFVTVFLLAAGALSLEAAPRSRACFYEKPDYQGKSFCVRVGRSSRAVKPRGWTGPIASMRLFGRSLVIFHYQRNYRGRAMVVTVDEPDLNKYGRMRADMRALRVRRGRISPRVCFYSKPGFRGKYFCKTPFQYVASLELIGWRGKIGSFVVRGRAQIRFFDEIEFKGARKILLTKTNANVTRTDLNQWVKSLRVQRRGDPEKIR